MPRVWRLQRLLRVDNWYGAAVYRIEAPGDVVRILAAPEVRSPNGIQISPDDQTLYLVESGRGPSDPRQIRRYDLSPVGTVRNPKALYDSFPGRSADGMSIDVEGNQYASTGRMSFEEHPRHWIPRLACT